MPTEEVHYDGGAVPAGARVLLSFGAANRDPRHYPDPDTFDLRRNPVDHVGFPGLRPPRLCRPSPGAAGIGGTVAVAHHARGITRAGRRSRAEDPSNHPRLRQRSGHCGTAPLVPPGTSGAPAHRQAPDRHPTQQ